MKAFLNRIPSAQTPSKVTQEYLEAAGFRSKNDRAIISVLKFVGLLDEEGKPTESYTLLRDKNQAGAILASLVKQTYSELFEMYPDAQNQSSQTLKNFFSTKTTGAEPVVNQIVATFKGLCEQASFEATGSAAFEPVEKATRPESQSVIRQTQTPMPSWVVINLNIQLQLPPTEDSAIYDKIFQSLKKHLLEREPSAST